MRRCMEVNHLADMGSIDNDVETAALVLKHLIELLKQCPRDYSEGYCWEKTVSPLRYPLSGATETTIRVWEDQACQMLRQIYLHLNFKAYKEGKCTIGDVKRCNKLFKPMC